MTRVALLLGGNQGDVKRTLQTAQQLINSRVGAVLRCSHRYESAPWGFPAAQRFSNQALEVSTDLSPLEVLDACQQIERELFIASGTLKAHIQHIYVKCGVHSRKELIALCGGE